MSNRSLVLGVFLLCFGAAQARAADLDPPYVGSEQVPEARVEFGSGWYIRGDIGVTHLPAVTTGGPSLLSNSEAAGVFNAGGNPQIVNDKSAALAPSIARSSNLGYTASLGGGYQVRPWFRADVVADFNEPVSGRASRGDIFCQTGIVTPQVLNGSGVAQATTGDCTGTYNAKLSSYSVLVNGYIDIGTWYGVTPYVGAGLGMSFGHYQSTATYTQGNNASYNVSYTDQSGGTTNANFDRTSSGTYYNFAWALMGGVSIDVYDRTKLDIGYRYVNLGKISGIGGSLYTSQIRAGVRYSID